MLVLLLLLRTTATATPLPMLASLNSTTTVDLPPRQQQQEPITSTAVIVAKDDVPSPPRQHHLQQQESSLVDYSHCCHRLRGADFIYARQDIPRFSPSTGVFADVTSAVYTIHRLRAGKTQPGRGCWHDPPSPRRCTHTRIICTHRFLPVN